VVSEGLTGGLSASLDALHLSSALLESQLSAQRSQHASLEAQYVALESEHTSLSSQHTALERQHAVAKSQQQVDAKSQLDLERKLGAALNSLEMQTGLGFRL